MLAVIRIRGRVGVRRGIRDTLKMLRLEKKNSCIVVPETPQYLGMVRKVRDFVTWGPVSDQTLQELVAKRARNRENGKIGEEKVKSVVKNLKEGKKDEIKPYFSLSPPSKGFKGSVKQHYPRGALGNRGDKINELLKRMI
ncbi:MAG: 50S ribosomal protein L30 [archaeon]|nr:MAG: 50S ribosomal protein L30 [archaeon]